MKIDAMAFGGRSRGGHFMTEPSMILFSWCLSFFLVWACMGVLPAYAGSLDDKQVETLLVSGFTSSEVRAQVRDKGYGGASDAETLRRLKAAGADADLILLLKAGGKEGSQSRNPADRKAETAGNFTNSIGMEMVWVEPLKCWVGKYEVTQTEYEKVMGQNPSKFKDPRRPVECVTWDAAAAFVAKLTQVEETAGRLPGGFRYQLPSEKQWKVFVGDAQTEDDIVMPEYKNAVTSLYRKPRSGTEKVGTLAPNQYGLYDVVGNVWEWCAGWDEYNFSDSKKKFHVNCGGCWESDITDFVARGGQLRNVYSEEGGHFGGPVTGLRVLLGPKAGEGNMGPSAVEKPLGDPAQESAIGK